VISSPAPMLRRLRDDTRGATIIEFAIVAPVMCVLLLAAFDISHTLYTRSVMQGMVQKTARDATIENGSSATSVDALDAKVRGQMEAMYNGATVLITRRFYRTFTDAAAAREEVYTDTNGNGRCDANEPYEDANRNGAWDADGGNGGQGGAKDATLYTVTMTYPRLMPITSIIGGSTTTKVVAQTVLRNQPYGDQGTYGAAVVRNCP
jgi:Flp pilus assembly protein TadG